MLNSKDEAKVGHNDVANAFCTTFPEASDGVLFAYFSTLYGIAAAADPEIIVEIGCQYGISTSAFLAATPKFDRQRLANNIWKSLPNEPERVLHSIDVDPEAGKATAGRVAALGCSDRWVFHLGRSQDIEPIECDLLYIDGDHGYPAVCSDLARHGVKVRDGGLVVLDDYHWSWPGKVRWVDERWDLIDPIIIGPTAVFRMTPAKRAACSMRFP